MIDFSETWYRARHCNCHPLLFYKALYVVEGVIVTVPRPDRPVDLLETISKQFLEDFWSIVTFIL